MAAVAEAMSEAELTEERLTAMVKHFDEWGECSEAEFDALVAEVRRLREVENDREEARGLAREYLYALWEEDTEEVRNMKRAREAAVHSWLLEPEPRTATGVAHAVFGSISVADSDSGSSSGWVKGGEGVSDG
jgi:hypothetical protein